MPSLRFACIPALIGCLTQLCNWAAATAESAPLVSVPTAELVQLLRNTGDEGLPKGLDLSLITPYSVAFSTDYLYVASPGAINYLKRDLQTGKLTYSGAIPWERGRVTFCVIGSHLYALGPAPEKGTHAFIWYDLDPSTGKPIEKGRFDGPEEGEVIGPVAGTDGKSFYYASYWNVCGCRLEADGKPVPLPPATGKGVRISSLQLSPDGSSIYTMDVREAFDLALVHRTPDGSIAYANSIPLNPILRPHEPYEFYQEPNLAGISPDGKWLHLSIYDRVHDNVFATYQRDPSTGALTLKDFGVGTRQDREDFKLANEANVKLLFNAEGTGGFITGNGARLQSFRYDPVAGRICDISDVVISTPDKGNCRPLSAVFDAKSGFLYGVGLWQHDAYGAHYRGLYALRTSIAKVAPGGRTDLVSTRAPAAGRSVATWGSDSDWPRFRGPAGDGSSSIKNIRTDWSKGLPKVWEVTGLSPGDCTWSAPSIQGNKLIVMGTHGFIEEIYCFDADLGGRPLWIAEFKGGGDVWRGGGRDGWRGGPSSTPTIHGDKVYAVTASNEFVCLSLADGKLLWRRGVASASHGYSASPLISGDLVIASGIVQASGKPTLLVGMKADTGSDVWAYGGEVPPGETPFFGHTSPLRMKFNGTEQVIYNTGALACGLDPLTGKPFWEYKQVFPDCIKSATNPVTDGFTLAVLLGDGMGKPYALQIQNGAAKTIWEKIPNWCPMWSDAVQKDGCIYTYSADSFYSGANSDFRCVDLKTGAAKWIEKKTGCGQEVLTDAGLICLTFNGDLWLVDPSPDGFKKRTEWKGAVKLEPWWTRDGGKSLAPAWTGPVIARGKLYLRYSDKLTCYDLAQ